MQQRKITLQTFSNADVDGLEVQNARLFFVVVAAAVLEGL